MRRAPASGGVGRGGERGPLGCPRLLRIKDLGESGSHRIPPSNSEARHPPPTPEPSRRPGGPEPKRAASRPCAGHRVRCCGSGIRRALALSVPSPPPSPAAPRSRRPGCSLLPLPRKLTELERGGWARSPASQLIQPTPFGARERPLAEPPGSCARSGREGGARAPGAHRCGVLASSAPHAPPRPPAPRAPRARGSVWGQGTDGAGSGKAGSNLEYLSLERTKGERRRTWRTRGRPIYFSLKEEMNLLGSHFLLD
uniref:Uncharacterized protein n=1 Tax=Mustela putorius furo TaxID=9669 RepID=M3XPK0_MUSPF